MPYHLATRQTQKWWREMDSNHRTRWEQIYSLSRLATSLPLQKNGAETRTWTRNLLITSQLLYQLSYFGINKWWAIQDSNLWPLACKASALTNWAMLPKNLHFSQRVSSTLTFHLLFRSLKLQYLDDIIETKCCQAFICNFLKIWRIINHPI